MLPMNRAPRLDAVLTIPHQHNPRVGEYPTQCVVSGHSCLEITQQPPQKWYKDQFGRKATFDVRVRRVLQGCHGCAEQRHLVVTMLYENGKPVENQSIMRVASGLCLNKEDQSTLAIRIMEVSKNHQNQKFRVRIALPRCPLQPPASNVAVVISGPVLVLSKKNKRPIKGDAEDPKAKKSKCVISPFHDGLNESAQLSPSAFSTPTAARSLLQPTKFTSGFPDESDTWESDVVRFKTPSASVCLWANAASNFLHKLQFQKKSSDLQGILPAFECPVCGAVYTGKAAHRRDCDLGLLLMQTGAIDAQEWMDHRAKDSLKPDVLNLTPSKNKLLGSTEDRLTPETVNRQQSQEPESVVRPGLSQVLSESTKLPFGSQSVDILAKNLDLSTWCGYSQLSTLMFSMENSARSPKGVASQQRTTAADQQHIREIKPNDGTSATSAMSLSALQSSTDPTTTTTANDREQFVLNPSFSLSKFMSGVKDLLPETASLLQEQDAQLLTNLSRVSIEDVQTESNRPQIDMSSISTSFSALLASTLSVDMTKRAALENSVMAIAIINFYNCGYPAFDASFDLLGFYHLNESESNAELVFVPNLYPLHATMLQELKENVAAWKTEPNALQTRPQNANDESALAELKRRTILSVSRPLQ